MESAVLGRLLVPDFETSNAVEHMRREGDVVVALRLLVDILYDNIDSLPSISLFQIGVPDQICILENLWGLEVGRNGELSWSG